jgi:hypothetical protein
MILIIFFTHIDGFKTHFMRKPQIFGYRKPGGKQMSN